jgi:hypothetical protein
MGVTASVISSTALRHLGRNDILAAMPLDHVLPFQLWGISRKMTGGSTATVFLSNCSKNVTTGSVKAIRMGK